MIYILISILLFGWNNVLWKKNLSDTPIVFLAAYRSFFTSIIGIILVFSFYDAYTIFNQPFLLITVGSLLGVIGLFCMLTVLKKAPLLWIGIYNLLGIILSAIYLVIYKKIELNHTLPGLLLLGVGFSLYLNQQHNTKVTISLKQHLYLGMMTIAFGLSSFVHWENLGDKVPPLILIANQELVVFIISVSTLYPTISKVEFTQNIKTKLWKVLRMAILVFLALFCSFSGLKTTNPIISSGLFLASPITNILFGFIYFDEKISLKNSIAIVIMALGAFALHYSTISQ
jgi:drug/metabolite transporter (DMT)-like permease